MGLTMAKNFNVGAMLRVNSQNPRVKKHAALACRFAFELEAPLSPLGLLLSFLLSSFSSRFRQSPGISVTSSPRVWLVRPTGTA